LNASSALSVSGYPNKDYIEFPLPNNKWARIYKASKAHDNFVIDKSFYLAGTGNIPNLWLYVGATLDTDESKFNIDLGHNEFLFEAFKDMFASEWKLMDLTNPGRFVREIQLFYNQNKNKINNLRKLFDGQPKKLGAGADGVAFALSSTLVLKIFKTELTYKHALQALKRLHENPNLAKTEAMIYDVGILGDFYGSPIYYYVIEKMRPVESLDPSVKTNLRGLVAKIALIINDTRKDKWDHLKNVIKNKSKAGPILQDIRDAASKLAKELKQTPYISNIKVIEKVLPHLDKMWLEQLIEEVITKYLTGRTDLHMGNIGLTKYNVFRYFDPVYNNTGVDGINVFLQKQ
jgi:hypothetical protein